MQNTFKTFLFLGALSALLVVVGGELGGRDGMIRGLLIALVMNGSAYWFSDSLVLAMTGARPLAEGEAPELAAMIERLAQRAKIPAPRLYIVQNPTPNAFATGRNPQNAAIAVHTGLLELLDQAEVEGVLAHEMSHVLNRDTLISALAATFAAAIGAVVHMAQFSLMFGLGRSDRDEHSNPFGEMLLIVLAPLMATFIQLAVSRSREYQADATAARLTGNPLGLASALAKLGRGGQALFARRGPAPDPALAHLMIVNPLRGGGVRSLFSTHPSIESRIERLEALARPHA